MAIYSSAQKLPGTISFFFYYYHKIVISEYDSADVHVSPAEMKS